MFKPEHVVPVSAGEEKICLHVDQMIDYVDNRLTPERRVQIEAHLDQCRLCSEAVEGVRIYPDRKELQESFVSPTDNIRLQASLRNFLQHHWKAAYALAAVLALGLASVLYLAKDQPNQTLFADFFHRYPSAFSLVRGEQAAGKLAAALRQYEAENFAGALQIFQEILAAEPSNMTAHFYVGLVRLETKDSPGAITHLQNVLQDKKHELAEPAAWYLALAYLQKNDLAQAKLRLSQIIAEDGAYKEKAAKLLERLS